MLPRFHPHLAVWLMCLACGGLLASAPVNAQATRAYKDGKDAIEAKNWAQAEKLMRAAIADDPEARRRTFSRYTPYFYLGVALAEQGDCRGALEAWRQTDRFGALREGGDEERELEQRRTRCQSVLEDVKKAVAAATRALERADEAAESLERRSHQELLAARWNEGTPSFAARDQEAKQLLASAREKLKLGDQDLDLDVLAEAGYQADEAARRFEKAVADADASLAAVNQAISEATGDLDQAERQARALLRSVSSIAPYPKRLGVRVSALRRVVAKIDRGRDSASAADLAALTEELIRETEALRPLADKPPSILLDAGAAFLANDFQGVLDLLPDDSFEDERSRFQAGLLRSAALYGLYVLSLEQDQDLLGRCQEAIRQLAGMDDSLGHPGVRFFSPRFRRLFDETVKQVRQDAEAGKETSGEGASSGQTGPGQAGPGRTGTPQS